MKTINNQQSTINNQQSTINNQQSTIKHLNDVFKVGEGKLSGEDKLKFIEMAEKYISGGTRVVNFQNNTTNPNGNKGSVPKWFNLYNKIKDEIEEKNEMKKIIVENNKTGNREMKIRDKAMEMIRKNVKYNNDMKNSINTSSFEDAMGQISSLIEEKADIKTNEKKGYRRFHFMIPNNETIQILKYNGKICRVMINDTSNYTIKKEYRDFMDHGEEGHGYYVNHEERAKNKRDFAKESNNGPRLIGEGDKEAAKKLIEECLIKINSRILDI